MDYHKLPQAGTIGSVTRSRKKLPKTVSPGVRKIREIILKIPRGTVSSYGAIAHAAGIPGGARVVVRVLNQSHGLPWHRVVAAGGRIALPGEHGLDQRFRLEMEGVKFSGKKVRMAEFEFRFPKKKLNQKKRLNRKATTVDRRRRAPSTRGVRVKGLRRPRLG